MQAALTSISGSGFASASASRGQSTAPPTKGWYGAPVQGMFAASAPLFASQRGIRRGASVITSARSGEGSTPEGASRLSLNLLSMPVLPQGLMVSGVKTSWRTTWKLMMNELAPQTPSGSYARPQHKFSGWIGRDSEFPIEYGRYHLYVGNACPWCHRILLTLAVRSLQPHISITFMQDDAEKASRGGWVFSKESPDVVFNARDLKGVYDRASPGVTPYVGRCTAPLLVDKKRRRIVSNDSADIMRMLNEFDLPGGSGIDLYPEQLASEIDRINYLVYERINNGVYKCGFATQQAAYDQAVKELYEALDEVDARLAKSRFLMGDKLTEADLKLFPTIIRFDSVYATLFKCTARRIRDYPHINMWMRDVYQLNTPGGFTVKQTYSAKKAIESYYGQLFPLNPGGVVPLGPYENDLGINEPHARGKRQDNIYHMRDPARVQRRANPISSDSAAPGRLPGSPAQKGRITAGQNSIPL